MIVSLTSSKPPDFTLFGVFVPMCPFSIIITCGVPAVVMATPGYVGELQQTSQPQGGAVSVAPGQASAPPPAPAQFLAELQTTATAPPATTPSAGQTTPPAPAAPPPAQKTATGPQAAPPQATPTQTQYVTAEIQSSPSQTSNTQATPQYIVRVHCTPVTQYQTPVLLQWGCRQEFPHRWCSRCRPPSRRSGSYNYTDTPLYTQTTAAPYYEATPASGSQVVTTPVTSQTVSVTTGSGAVSMFVSGAGQIVANATPGAGGGEAVTAGATPSGTGAGGGGNGSGGSYVIQGGYVLGSSTTNQSYSHNARASPATVSILTEGEANSVPLADKKVQWLLDNYETAEGKVEGMTNGMALGAGQQQQQAGGLSDISAQVQQYQQFLDASRALPEFPDIDLQGKALPDGIELEHIKSFQLLYREHCEAMLDVMINLQFTLVETLWKTFWRFSENQATDTEALTVHDESEKRLPKSCLVLLCKYDPVLRWSRDCDNTLYQGLVEILIPDVLRPIPSALTQAIRNFAKSLENWLTNAMMNIPEEMVRIKVTSASAFAQTLRRYTSLNHLAQAARAVLQNTAQINQMLSDLNRVDFANVQEQASWVCRCEDRVVQRLEQDFKLTLQQQNSLEQWAAWLDGVVSQVLKPYQSSAALPKAAKLFLLKWSFYRVAQAKGETPIAVMGEFASLGRSLNPLDPDKEEEEDEEEESEDECQELSLTSDPAAIGVESLEPPAKLARTDPRVLFNTGQADN
ncbi:hypothetical protein JZ751_021524 [Albula glossodonta]|uniref:Uncharacterized protein n=1 Tax=Albula glossodonta TaxID=121402 RepID=A0A8T2NMX6_9TELE|nr:hypothetical protein JZ751_021524 [Albula glossodonta]